MPAGKTRKQTCDNVKYASTKDIYFLHTYIIFIRIVESIYNCWFSGPFIFINWLPQFSQILFSFELKYVKQVPQKFVLGDI